MPCEVSHGGEMRHIGDPAQPVPLDMRHSTKEPVALDLNVKPVQHGLAVQTTLQEPMHHALQLKTPLQVRFVNPWEAKSDYAVSIEVAGRALVTLRVNGTTTIKPEAAPPDPCVSEGAGLRVRTLPDVVGRNDTGRGE